MPVRSSHEALFYDDTDVLLERVAAYLTGGSADGAAIVIARAERLSELERALAARGFDLVGARETERLVTLDADAALASTMVDTMPDRAAFHDRIGGLVARLARRGELRVYGEMADLLWTAGRAGALLRLEQLWNELRAEHSFRLLCSYRGPSPKDLLGPADVGASQDRVSRVEPVATHGGSAAPGASTSAGVGSPEGSRAELDRVRELEDRVQRSERARDELFRAVGDARAAQRAAEEAVRARDEILAVVTHDLRNPLGTIVMGATALLQHGQASDPRAQRVRAVAERIHRQAERMTRQIRDLQDFTEIQSGRLAIERGLHAPSTIVAATKALAAPLAHERGIAFEAHADADLPQIDCDADRVIQALSSLVTNAIKVTRRGGSIEAGARWAEHQRVVFFVHHDGPSVHGDELSEMFAPAWRSKHPSYRGAALGFTIARGVIDAHGGTIWAESDEGTGGTVLFTLQPRGN